MKHVLNCWSKLDRSQRDLIVSRFICHHNLFALTEDLKHIIQNLDDTNLLDELTNQIDQFHDNVLKLVDFNYPIYDSEK